MNIHVVIWWHFLLVVAYLVCQVWSLKGKGLSNKHLRVVAVPWLPFLGWKCPNDTTWTSNWVTECPNGEDQMYNGILWDFLMFMKQAKNVSYTIMGIDDAWWAGTCYDSNNCTGMIGRVNRHEADFALGLLLNNICSG